MPCLSLPASASRILVRNRTFRGLRSKVLLKSQVPIKVFTNYAYIWRPRLWELSQKDLPALRHHYIDNPSASCRRIAGPAARCEPNQLMAKDLFFSATVVVCTCKRPLALARCLSAVVRLAYPSFSIVVGDNPPGDETVRSIALRHGAEYHPAPVRGVSRARNIGARACASEIVAYLDDDMVPHRDWLARIAPEFAADAGVMAVAGPGLPMECDGVDEAALTAEVHERPWGGLRFQVDRASPEWVERANFGGIGDGNMAL